MDGEQIPPARSETPSAPSQSAASNPGPAGWAVEILAPHDTAAATDSRFLPALLGLDALSLSLPTSTSKASKSKGSSRPDAATASTSTIRIHGIPANHVHLLFSSPALDTGIRSGFWIFVPSTASNISLKFEWNRDSEELEPLLVYQRSENKTPEASVKTFDYGELLRLKSGATADISAAHDEWTSLTRFITPVELDRLVPSHTTNPNGIQAWPISTLSTSTTESDLEATSQQADIHFTPITLKNTFPPSSIGRDRTKHSLDKSWYLSSILPSDTPSSSDTVYGSTLLAEFALSFLLANTVGSSSASQHWKDILRVSLRCTSAVTSSTTYTFFVELLQLLETQLRYLDLLPSPETQEDQVQHHEQNVSAGAAGSQAASALFESEDDLTALYDLLFAFGRKNLADSTTTPTSDSDSSQARTAVRTAYLSLAKATTSTTPSNTISGQTSSLSNWDLASALLSTSADDEDDKQHRRIQRRILRGMEGFGYGTGLEYGEAENDGIADGVVEPDADNDDEDDEDAPVVLDLEGLLASPNDDDDGVEVEVEKGESNEGESEEREDEDEDDEELEDLRY